MLKVLILVCAANLAPADCTPATAIDVITGPDVANPVMCGLHGQAYLAPTALAPDGTGDAYVKLVCVREWGGRAGGDRKGAS